MKRVLAFCFVICLSEGTHAQYFGRNKFQYHAQDFSVLQTEHFNIHYYLKDSTTVWDAARMAERWYERLASDIFHHPFEERKPIILYANQSDFQQTNVVEDFIGPGVGGFTEDVKNRLVIPFTSAYASTDHVLGHEMVHEFQYDIAQFLSEDSTHFLHDVPLWFIEGMAEYFSIGSNDPHTAMYLRDALLNDKLPTLKMLSAKEEEYFPYRWGEAFWAFVAQKWGIEKIPELYNETLMEGLEKAFQNVLGVGADSLSKMWIASIRSDYEPLIKNRTQPKDAGDKILASDIHAGELNLSPSVSPDGKYVIFISEKNIFSIELFLADAKSGKIIRRLTQSETRMRFDAINFISSSGSWSPDGKRFAFVVFSDGKNEIVILNVKTGKVEEQFSVPGVEAISDPAFSPDGKQIAFSGMTNGVSDLYVIDCGNPSRQSREFSKELTQLTDDRYADFQPVWSPDGKTIAFVTDRVGIHSYGGRKTNFEQLIYSSPQIALMNIKSKQIQVLPLFQNGKHINPQFSPDGKSLHFISDADGFSDIYRFSLENSKIYRVTTIATGVSGITEWSPAISVAGENGLLMFSVFEKNNYNVYSLSSEKAQGKAIYPAYAGGLNTEEISSPARGGAGFLPPLNTSQQSSPQIVYENAKSSVTGINKTRTYPYRPKLSLDYFGGFGGAAETGFGTFAGGQVFAQFSDILGNYRVGVMGQVSGRSFKEFGGAAYYLNLKHRLQWGGMAGHIPYVRTFNFVSRDNDRLYEGELRDYIFMDELFGLVIYPLSLNRRVELGSGYLRYSYALELIRKFEDGTKDKIVFDVPPPLNLYNGWLAYVGDYSYFGFTSPVKGRRYRFSIEPTFGSVNYMSLLADYRHYFFARPVTVAFRTMYYGRHGKDGDSGRLNPVFLGNEFLIRGYSYASFTGGECPGNSNDCPAFDRLFGSRVAVFNAEIRYPLVGIKKFGLIHFRWLPVEVAGFFDGGLAWTSSELPLLKFSERSTERIPVFSAGVSARVNILGAAVVEFYYAYPFQRPDKGAHFGFVIVPGW